INFNSGHVFKIDLAYDAKALVLTETVTDTVTNAKFSTSYKVDIAAHLGSNVGYVGFGGGTGGETAVQDVLSWTYHSAGRNEHMDGDSGAAGTPGQVPAASDPALLVGVRSASGSFRVDTAMPLAGSPEISPPIGTGALEGGGNPSSSVPLIGDAGSGSDLAEIQVNNQTSVRSASARPPSNGLAMSMDAIDQVFNSQELFDVL